MTIMLISKLPYNNPLAADPRHGAFYWGCVRHFQLAVRHRL